MCNVKKCIVLGNSFSINKVDIYKAKKGDGSIISIGVNRIMRPRLVDNYVFIPDNLVVVDSSVFNQEYERIIKYCPNLFIRDSLYDEKKKFLKDYPSQITKTQHLSGSKRRTELLTMKGVMYPAGNTGIYAIELAYRLMGGVGEIGIIGMEFLHVSGEPTHFWGDGSKDGCRPFFEKPIKWFESAKDILYTKNFKVYSLSPYHDKSRIKNCLRYMDFDEFCRT